MSCDAHSLTYQAMFWFERAKAGSINAGRPEFWRRRCLELASRLIAAGLCTERQLLAVAEVSVH